MVYPDEPLRVVVYRMAETGLTRLPVIDDEKSRKLVGIISLEDLLHARVRNLEEERRRERVLRIHMPFGGADGNGQSSVGSGGSSETVGSTSGIGGASGEDSG